TLLRLVRRVCRRELGAAEHVVDDRGDLVGIRAGAEEDGGVGRGVPRRQRLEPGAKLGLRRAGGKVDRRASPQRRGDGGEEIVDRPRAAGREHGGDVGGRVGAVAAHFACSLATLASYAAASRRPSTSSRLAIEMRIIQPAPYGSRFTCSGSSRSAWLTAVTRPLTGAKRSETVLFDSTSPSASCAKSVMPMMPSFPSSRSHSWSFV